MKICITVGHSKLKNGNYTSASGIKVEYLYCKEQGQALKTKLEKEGHQVTLIICPEGQFSSAKEEVNYKLSRINGKRFDLVIELHLNCYNSSAKGTEVLYYSTSTTSKIYAQRVVNKLGTKFINRGAKSNDSLYILRSTDCNAILIESFFCDSKVDCDIADKLGVDGVANLIAEGIINKEIKDEPVKEDIYKIATGGFGSKEAAENKLSYLKGITGWYLEVKGSDFHIETGGFTGKEKVERKMNALKELTGWWMEYRVD
ncbi:MAG: N-acetylmuramoyl-L-alanine amidase [Romboutsia sp.]